MTCRKGPIADIETRPERTAWEEPGGSLPTGQAVSGVEVARAWPGLRCGTCEPVVPRPRAASGASSGPRPRREAIARRLAECGLELNEQKTRIARCKDDDRPGSYEH